MKTIYIKYINNQRHELQSGYLPLHKDLWSKRELPCSSSEINTVMPSECNPHERTANHFHCFLTDVLRARRTFQPEGIRENSELLKEVLPNKRAIKINMTPFMTIRNLK
jgi:hypothetical protein